MKKRIVLMGMAICLLTACSNNQSSDTQAASDESNKKVSVQLLAGTGSNENEESKNEESKNEDSKTVSKEGVQLQDNIVTPALQGRCEEWSIVGIQQSNVGNLGMNIKLDGENLLVCKDPVYDVTYYVNHGEDYYIYRLKDGKSELAVKMPANYLYSMNGTLYFMVDSYNFYTLEGMKQGDIYKYVPTTGEVTLVASVGAHTMSVERDGIYCEALTLEETDSEKGETMYSVSTYFYSFLSDTITEVKYIRMYSRWRDYFVDYATDEGGNRITGFQLTQIEDRSNTIPLLPSYRPSNFCIEGDSFYYIHDGIEVIDLLSKEKKEYHSKWGECFDFIKLGDNIYLNTCDIINTETGGERILRKPTPETILSYMFTDGEHLFALYHEGNFNLGGKPGRLVQIEIEEMDDTEEVESVQMPDGSFNTQKFLKLVPYVIGGGKYE